MAPNANWQLKPQSEPQPWLIDLLHQRSPLSSGRFAAQLLWQRGWQDPQSVLAFLDPTVYQPASPWEFGIEMEQAVTRLLQARDRQETVFIWGDFDADGITATAVLWEGLAQLFIQHQTLQFTIPNRLTESHGLSISGIDAITAQGCQLIVTCDNGSSDAAEINYAQQLGIDVIITDHHTLPSTRPPVAAFINPRTLPIHHPLAHLSGVAVAYKLVEALYEQLSKESQNPQAPLENLLDLVAIGLIADLVQLTGDCRYLAQQGLIRLKQQLDQPTRPGVAKLLELCKRNGDRPSDIAFGLGPRINAISRIQGDAREGVELLTTRDPERAVVLAQSAEWTNLCRKEVQQRIIREAEAQLARIDLDATAVLILHDPQWPVGILGLVASHLAQTYGKPAIVLNTAASTTPDLPHVAKGSARSVRGIDLYDLLMQHAHLLHRFGGHPLAAGVSLPIANLPLFTTSMNQWARQQWGPRTQPVLEIDLIVSLADIVPNQGAALFRELLQLEPCGMGNPTPRLLIRDCWFERSRSSRSQIFANQKLQLEKLQFKKTQFQLRDSTTATAFPGLWWDHDANELPEGRCDVVVELEYGKLYKKDEYYVRLIAVQPTTAKTSDILPYPGQRSAEPWLLDWRQHKSETASDRILCLEDCPDDWDELKKWGQTAKTRQQQLALAYSATEHQNAVWQWQQLVGMAKYAARTQQPIQLTQLQARLGLSGRSRSLGLAALKAVGFKLHLTSEEVTLQGSSMEVDQRLASQAIQRFLDVCAEEQFQQHYFQAAPVVQLQQVLEQRLTELD